MIAGAIFVVCVLALIAAIAIFGDGDMGCAPECPWCRND